MKSILVMASGGMKTAVLCEIAKRDVADVQNVTLLLFDYQQESYQEEKRAVAELAKYYGFNHMTWDTSMLPAAGHNKTWPLFQMTILQLMALEYAHMKKFTSVYCGVAADQNNIPKWETSREGFKSTQSLLSTIQPEMDSFGLCTYRTELERPLIMCELWQVALYGEKFNAPWHMTWDCEESDTLQCGLCDSCIQRQRAFERAGIDDATPYKYTHKRIRKTATGNRPIDKSHRVGDISGQTV